MWKLNSLIEEFIHMFRSMGRYVDPHFRERLCGQRMHKACRIRSGAVNLEQIAGSVSKNALGHMTSTRIAGAQDENRRFGIGVHFYCRLSGGGSFLVRWLITRQAKIRTPVATVLHEKLQQPANGLYFNCIA